MPRSRCASDPRILGLGALSGLLFTLGIPSVDLSFLAWICLLPCFLVLSQLPPRALACLGLVCGLVGGGGRLYWLTATLQLYGHLWWPAALFTNALLVLYLALYPACFLLFCSRLCLHSPLFPWMAASAWVLLEWIQTWLITGFPWELLGYSQYLNRPLVQLASITGVYGLSFLIVLVNAALAQIVLLGRRGLVFAGAPALALAAALLYGHLRLQELDSASGPLLKVGVVQGNFSQDEKWKVHKSIPTTRRYIALTRSLAASGPLDLIVYPETALPYRFGGDSTYAALRHRIAALARQTGVPLLVGSLQSEGEGTGERLYNRAFLVDAGGEIRDFSDKVHLVPFGEYLPLPWIFGYLKGLTAESGRFTRGARHKVLSLGEQGPRFGVFICYESIFPDIARRLARRGAEFLVNTTNDAWFGRSAAPYQHFSMAVLRAVETGRPLVRAANTGISGLISPSGEILQSTALFETTTLTASFIPRAQSTFYLRHGDSFLALCALFLAGGILQSGIRSGRRIQRERRQARRELEEFARRPLPLPRPLVLLHGYRGNPLSWKEFTRHLERCSTNAATHLLAPEFNADLGIGELAQKLAAELPRNTEVDLVGHSLGALVAVELFSEGVLLPGRLLALAAPFGGVALASLARRCGFAFPRLLRDLDPAGVFVRRLPPRLRELAPSIFSFRAAGDPLVAERGSRVLEAQHRRYAMPLWTPLLRRHHLVHTDPRILRDLIALLQHRHL